MPLSSFSLLDALNYRLHSGPALYHIPLFLPKLGKFLHAARDILGCPYNFRFLFLFQFWSKRFVKFSQRGSNPKWVVQTVASNLSKYDFSRFSKGRHTFVRIPRCDRLHKEKSSIVIVYLVGIVCTTPFSI